MINTTNKVLFIPFFFGLIGSAGSAILLTIGISLIGGTVPISLNTGALSITSGIS